MTRILTSLITENIDNYKYVQLYTPFVFQRDKLKEAGLKCRVEVPVGFVYDQESVPWVRGTNARGGTAHDYLCRTDSNPLVTKAIAASVYLEIMSYTYEIVDRGWMQHLKDFTRRWTKWAVVYVAPGYFHKFKVLATCKEIAGIDGDPYVTIEKLDALIEKTEKVSEDLKDVKVDQKAEMIVKTDQVTADLKEAKEDVLARDPANITSK